MLAVLLAPLARAADPCPPIEDRLLPWTEEREALTLAYLRAHRGPPPDPAAEFRLDPRVIVVHWTAGPSAESAWNTFAPARLSGRAELQDAGALNVSAHFLVDRDGSIQRLLPEDRIARHAIGLNHVALGIENVGGTQDLPLTDEQLAANAALVRCLASRHPITHLLGHLETNRMEGHPYFVELDPEYRTSKPDPGAAFMAALRLRLAGMPLEGPPP